jgi:hypothetical protein
MPVSKRSIQSLLTVDEENVFKDTFHGVIHSSKPINTDHVCEVVKKHPKLKHLTNMFSNRQLADRVRTARKAVSRVNERKALCKKTRK